MNEVPLFDRLQSCSKPRSNYTILCVLLTIVWCLCLWLFLFGKSDRMVAMQLYELIRPGMPKNEVIETARSTGYELHQSFDIHGPTCGFHFDLSANYYLMVRFNDDGNLDFKWLYEIERSPFSHQTVFDHVLAFVGVTRAPLFRKWP